MMALEKARMKKYQNTRMFIKGAQRHRYALGHALTLLIHPLKNIGSSAVGASIYIHRFDTDGSPSSLGSIAFIADIQSVSYN